VAGRAVLRSPSIRLPGWLDVVVVGLVAGLFQVFPWYQDVGMVEEWGVYQYFDSAGIVPWAPSDPQLMSQAIRPLTVFAHSVAYAISPDSFVPLQAVQAVAIAIKAGAMLLLLRALGLKRSIAVAGGLLYGLFPAHDASFSTRGVHMHWASAFVVLALWLFVVQIRRGATWAVTLAMVTCQALSLLFYEASYGIVAVTPLLVLAYRGLSPRRRLLLTGIWYIVPLINGIRIVLLMTSGKVLYQEATIVHDEWISKKILVDAFEFVWRGTWSPVTSPHGHAVAVLPVLSLVLLAAIVALGTRTERPAHSPSWRYPAIAVGGFLLAPVTVLVFLPNPGFLIDPLRVFAVAPLPLTLALCAGVAFIGGRARHAELVAAAILIPLTLTAAQADRLYWHHRSDEQRQILGEIAAATSHAPRSDHLLILDGGGVLGQDVYALQGPLLVTALRYLRHAPDDVVSHCGVLGSPAVAGVTSACSRTANGYIVDGAPPARYPVVVVLKPSTKPPVPADMANITSRERDLLPCIRRRTCRPTATLVPG
jgi:hypothetical protein